MIFKIRGRAGEITGEELEIQCIKTTVKDLIGAVEKNHRGFRKEIGEHGYIILKNGTDVNELKRLDTLVTNTDVIQILPKLMGG